VAIFDDQAQLCGYSLKHVGRTKPSARRRFGFTKLRQLASPFGTPKGKDDVHGTSRPPPHMRC